MISWKHSEPDIATLPLESLLSKLNVIDGLRIKHLSQFLPVPLIHFEAKKCIYDHLRTKVTELGGLLLGSIYSLEDIETGVVAIEINGAIPCESFSSSAVSLTMDTEIWDKARIITTKNYFVVGWYHSHPNLGAFFSGTDRKTQKNFFNSSFHLGLVIDPIRDEEKWFIGKDSIEVSHSLDIHS